MPSLAWTMEGETTNPLLCRTQPHCPHPKHSPAVHVHPLSQSTGYNLHRTRQKPSKILFDRFN